MTKFDPLASNDVKIEPAPAPAPPPLARHVAEAKKQPVITETMPAPEHVEEKRLDEPARTPHKMFTD